MVRRGPAASWTRLTLLALALGMTGALLPGAGTSRAARRRSACQVHNHQRYCSYRYTVRARFTQTSTGSGYGAYSASADLTLATTFKQVHVWMPASQPGENLELDVEHGGGGYGVRGTLTGEVTYRDENGCTADKKYHLRVDSYLDGQAWAKRQKGEPAGLPGKVWGGFNLGIGPRQGELPPLPACVTGYEPGAAFKPYGPKSAQVKIWFAPGLSVQVFFEKPQRAGRWAYPLNRFAAGKSFAIKRSQRDTYAGGAIVTRSTIRISFKRH